MGLLLIEDAKCSERFQGQRRQLSASFKEALSRQLSPKLERKVSYKGQDLYERICFSAEKFSGYEVYRNGISALPFRIETREGRTWVGECCVIWKSQPGKKIFTPWDELHLEDIECGMLMDRKNTDALKRILAMKKEENLSFAYGVKTPVYGQTVTGVNDLRLGVDIPVGSAMLLETAYLCENFARLHKGKLATEGWPRQRGDFEIGMRILLGQGQGQVFGAFLEALEGVSFPLRYIKCNAVNGRVLP